MRSILTAALTASLAAAGLLVIAGSTPAAAARQYPWCSRTSATGFNPSYSFTSYAQCMATVSGQRGECVQNPYLLFNREQRHTRKKHAWRERPDEWDNGWGPRW